MTLCPAAHSRLFSSSRTPLLSTRPFFTRTRRPRFLARSPPLDNPSSTRVFAPALVLAHGRAAQHETSFFQVRVLTTQSQISPSPIPTPTPTRTAMEQLAQKVDGMSLDAITEKYPNCHPEINPFDFYRAHLSNVLADITGVDTKIIYPALSWTQSLDKGDLILAAPALRIKGQKPDELVKQWAEKVAPTRGRSSCFWSVWLTYLHCSFQTMTPSSRNRPRSATSWPSSPGPPQSSRVSSP